MGESNGTMGAAQPAAVEGRSMAVLYGTETGIAEEIAVELGKMAERLHFKTRVDEMDGFKLADVLHTSLVIFVTSTTGQGDMPKNTLKFWKNLRREKLTNSNCLRSVRFASFGLGDSSYLKFNWASRKLRARLLQLGASEFFRFGEGDERHDNGIDSIYLPWYQELKETLIANYPLPESISPIPDDVQLPPKYPLQLLSAMDIDTEQDGAAEVPSMTDDDRKFQALSTKSAARSHIVHPTPAAEQARADWARLHPKFPAHIARQDPTWEQRQRHMRIDSLDKDNILKDHPEKYLLRRNDSGAQHLPPDTILPIPGTYVGTLVCNDRVTPADHWQDVRHLAFSLPLKPKDFESALESAGNLTLTIYPKNYPEDVQELIDMMGWEEMADRLYRVPQVPRGLYLSRDGLTTVRELLTHNLDITAIPKRSFIKELVFFTDDEREKERLVELTMPGNEQEFYDYTSRPRRTILELLRDFTNVKIPTSRILDLFPIIRGREFSVCNGGLSLKDAGREHSVRLEILAALVEYKTIIRKPRQGLCSRYLKHLPVGTDMCFGIATSSGDHLVPNRMAAKRPLIAIATGTGIAPIRSIIHERASYRDPGDTLLFFGCRNRAADFHFADEWQKYPNLLVFPAFSRDNITPDPATTVHTNTNTTHTTVADTIVDAVAPPEYDMNKNYVQHMIRKHAREVGLLMCRNPIVCVCGNAGRMPISVRNALLDALVMTGVVDDKEAAETWFRDPKNLTFWQETW